MAHAPVASAEAAATSEDDEAELRSAIHQCTAEIEATTSAVIGIGRRMRDETDPVKRAALLEQRATLQQNRSAMVTQRAVLVGLLWLSDPHDEDEDDVTHPPHPRHARVDA